MQKRIHEILIVSSFYDAFKLYEDGRLAEMIISEYEELDLQTKPKVVRVSTAEHAWIKLKDKKIDLIITMARISDLNPYDFANEVKERYTNIPIILMTSNKKELKWVQENADDLSGIDKVFFWLGNSAIFPAIIKQMEDKKNANRDIQKGMVRTIIVVEDSPHFYSLILPLMYRTIIKYTMELIKLEYTDNSRLLRMYSRPKVLLATNFEEAINYYNKYKDNLLAIVTDTRFPINGKSESKAGLKFLDIVREESFQIPMVVVSKEVQKKKKYFRKLNAEFIDKNSADFLNELQKFIVTHCGFGKLKFNLKNSRKIVKVNSLVELRNVIKYVTEKSIEKHAKNNHFSNWLAIRGYYELADLLNPMSYRDMDNSELFFNLIDEQLNYQATDKLIIFNTRSYSPEYKFVRMGDGSLGGKGRGLAFLVSLLKEYSFQRRYQDVKIEVPNFLVIATNHYDTFIEKNNMFKKILTAKSDSEIDDLFLKAKFSRNFQHDIKHFLKENKKPLAIRSSSLLEDSFLEPFAGIYRTFMLANSEENLKQRVEDLLNTIKLVYASIFTKKTKSFLNSVGHKREDEKMAVVIQELIGEKHENYFYPTFSGIMQSYNYYPQHKMRRENGLATVALGLGKQVVEGEKSLKFSPYTPKVIPQFYNTKSVLKNSQNTFYALNLDFKNSPKNEYENLVKLPISDAKKEGVMELISSVFSAHDSKFIESLDEKGQRVITFANILKWKTFPLAKILTDLSEITRKGLGCDVEIEFASNTQMNSDEIDSFSILQVRPQITYDKNILLHEANDKENVIIKSNICLGNGIIEKISDILFIDANEFDNMNTINYAEEIDKLNKKFRKGRKYLLIGPGRWGTSDKMLGIPITWDNISNVACIVEVGIPDYFIEPSFGNHFFQNITSLNIPYFTIPPSVKSENINCEWISKQKQINKSKLVKHIKLEKPLSIKVDGKNGVGVVY
ncbi:MAG: PEP/pyruvate-binding domain-containing protein [Candidatus Marinimicrobia bacterium]|nr:PEP/pyruvate-binding domain-containing protein [Candidatus Neomarinimicrobiota bacterium]